MRATDTRQVGPSRTSPAPALIQWQRELGSLYGYAPACVTAAMISPLLYYYCTTTPKSPEELVCHVSTSDSFLQIDLFGFIEIKKIEI